MAGGVRQIIEKLKEFFSSHSEGIDLTPILK